jgi:peroxin-7
MLSTCAADGQVKIFDIRTQDPSRPIQIIQASPEEVLSCDWNKYDISTIATGGKDRAVKVWDMRSGRSECVEELRGHGLAVKRVQYVPKRALARA